MTKTEFQAFFRDLVTRFRWPKGVRQVSETQNSHLPSIKDVFGLYFRELGHLPSHELSSIVPNLEDNGPWFPTIAEIKATYYACFPPKTITPEAETKARQEWARKSKGFNSLPTTKRAEILAEATRQFRAMFTDASRTLGKELPASILDNPLLQGWMKLGVESLALELYDRTKEAKPCQNQ